MKQTMKRIVACTLAITMLMTLQVVTKAQAEVKDNLPKKVRIYTGSVYTDTDIRSQSARIVLADINQTVANVKSDSDNLKVGLTGCLTSVVEDQIYSHQFDIGMIPLANGTYTVTYDIVKNGVVISSEKMTVCAYPSPLKNLTVDGKETAYYKDKTKAKIKATLQAGNSIVKMQVGNFVTDKLSGQRPQIKYTTFKNGATVKLGTTCDMRKTEGGDRSAGDGYYHGTYTSSLESYTEICITYKDKYTKQEETIKKYLYGWMK